MSELPSEWKVLPLGEIAEVVGGGTPSRDNPAFWGNDHYWITPSEVVAIDGKIAGCSKEKISNLGLASSGAKLHPPGTILMTSRASIGFAAIAEKEICTNQGFQSLRCGEKLDNWFALHQIRHRRAELQQLAAGSTFLEISGSNVRSFPITIPPLPEQKKIAEILSGIDNVISKKNIRNEKQKTTASLILDSALSNAEYRQAPLSEIALLERGKFSHRPRNDPAYYGGEYPFIQTGDIPKSGIRICEHKQTLNEKGLQVSRQFPKGTIVITIAATIGEVGILSYPACFPDSLVGIAPKTEECDPVFLLFSLRRLKDKLLQMAPQSAQSNLNLEILGKLLLPLPPLNEQRQIARMICCEDSRASAESIGISKLQHMKKAVASDLLSGRKRVSV